MSFAKYRALVIYNFFEKYSLDSIFPENKMKYSERVLLVEAKRPLSHFWQSFGLPQQVQWRKSGADPFSNRANPQISIEFPANPTQKVHKLSRRFVLKPLDV